MNANYVHADYVRAVPAWRMADDCYAGELQVKAAGELYLPNPSPLGDPPEERRARYDSYVKRASFFNATRRTADGLAGLVFSRWPTYALPDARMENDIDGGGTTVVQQAQQAVNSTLLKGRCGLLADFPAAGGVSLAQVREGVKPIIRLFRPEQIINWRSVATPTGTALSLVVLSEDIAVEDDGFQHKTAQRLLVLRLVDGQATSQSHIKRDDGWDTSEVTVLKDSSGRALDSIPFFFVGAVDNNPTIDESPLSDIVAVNLAHYRTSADYEESNFICAQPSLFITGVTTDWHKSVLKDNPIRLGSRSANVLNTGSHAFLLQATSSGALFESMVHKEKQMVTLGARLVETSSGNKTATEIEAETASATSILMTVTLNVSEAYTAALRACAKYIGEDPDTVRLTLNTRFNTSKMTAAERQQLVAEWQGGAITFGEMRARLVEDEIATVENVDEARETIAAESGQSLL